MTFGPFRIHQNTESEYSVKSCVSDIRQDQRMMLIWTHSVARFSLITHVFDEGSGHAHERCEC